MHISREAPNFAHCASISCVLFCLCALSIFPILTTLYALDYIHICIMGLKRFDGLPVHCVRFVGAFSCLYMLYALRRFVCIPPVGGCGGGDEDMQN